MISPIIDVKAASAGSTGQISSIRKRTRKLGLSNSQGSHCPADEESEGCETVLNKVQSKSHNVSRYRSGADSESAEMQDSGAPHSLHTALSSDLPQPRSGYLGGSAEQESLQGASPCRNVGNGKGHARQKRSQRLSMTRIDSLKTDSIADDDQSQESLASEAGKGLPFCRQFQQDSSVCLDLQVHRSLLFTEVL